MFGWSVVRELIDYRELLKNLVLKDLKLRYRESVFGFLWSLLNPLTMLTVYTVVFTRIFKVQMPNFAYFLMVGVLPWNFFASSVLGSTGSIVGSGGLIRKVYFPLEILPIATVLFCLAQFLLAMSVVVPAAMIVLGIAPTWAALLFPPLLLLHLLFTIGLAFILSAVTTWFRDVAHLTEVALMLLFWVTPVIYSAEMMPPGLRRVIKVSPLAAFTMAYQDVLYHGRVPHLSQVLILLAWTFAVLTAGHTVFRRYRGQFAELV